MIWHAQATHKCCASSTQRLGTKLHCSIGDPACLYSLTPLRLSIVTCMLLSIAGCGGHSSSESGGAGSSPSGTVAITISPTSATVAAGGTQQFQATVTGSSNTSVQWQVNHIAGGNSQYGTISTNGLYTAPATGVPLQVTVTAVAIADTTKTASATVTVNPVPAPPPPPPPSAVMVTISPTTALLAVSTTQQFTATVTGSSNTAVTWSVDGVNGGNATVGTVSTSGLYTAPATPTAHTVTATSVADGTKSASAAVTVMLLTISPLTADVAPVGNETVHSHGRGNQQRRRDLVGGRSDGGQQQPRDHQHQRTLHGPR